MKRAAITGGAGFIGSNLADRLAARGIEVVVIDDFRTGRRAFLAERQGTPGFRLVEGDVLDEAVLDEAMEGCDWVFHLQANADVRHGLERPMLDLEQNTVATARVLDAARRAGVGNVLFSSTGSVYGEPDVFPTPEDAPFPLQTSLYGASKLAGEGLVSAFAVGFGMSAVICRFVSILGERYTHGHVIDFYRSLRNDPSRITVLGDGHQEKSYLYVQDCVSAMLTAALHHEGGGGVHVYNLGTEETIVVDDSLALIADALSCSPAVEHTGGTRGWTGDSPLIRLDTRKIRSLGWAPTLSIAEAVRTTVRWLSANEAVWREPAS
jgi:UDP-glucose 4-epimerase